MIVSPSFPFLLSLYVSPTRAASRHHRDLYVTFSKFSSSSLVTRTRQKRTFHIAKKRRKRNIGKRNGKGRKETRLVVLWLFLLDRRRRSRHVARAVWYWTRTTKRRRVASSFALFMAQHTIHLFRVLLLRVFYVTLNT